MADRIGSEWITRERYRHTMLVRNSNLLRGFPVSVKAFHLSLKSSAGSIRATCLKKDTLEEPAFDARENALRDCELFKTVLDDLQSETSGIGTYVLGSVTEAVKQSYVKLNDVRMGAIREARVNEWDIALRELNGRYDDFTRQMNAIYSRGTLEWRNANRSITAVMESWQQEYEDSFKAKAEDWTNRYITFLQKKEAWVDTIAAQAVQIGNNEILRNMGAMTRDAIADATSFIIPDVIELPDTDSFLATIVDRDLLSGLLASAGERNRGIEAFTPAIFQTLKRNAYNSAETLEKIRIFQTEENEEIAARLAFIRYDQALTTLKDAKKSLEENIDGANRSTWAGFRDMFIREGFTESGGNFIKNTTVGATLMDSLTEKHVIEGYRYFKTTVKDFTKGIMTPEEIDLEAIGATGIQALLDQAMGAVDEESKRIFGSSEDTTYEKDSLYKDTYQVKKYRLGSEAGERIEYMVDKVRYLPQTETVTQDDYDKYMKKLANLSDEQRSDLGQQIQHREVKSGEFNKWIGYAPVFLDDADPGHDLDEYWKNVRFAGSGETGRIMGLFTQHKMIEGSGRAEANMPAYSRRLWDDRGSFIAAPTIRSLTEIAITVAAGIVAPGAGNLLINNALNMIDDAMFTLLDIGNGMDPLDAMESLGKKAATSFASSAISGASSAFAASNSALTSGVIGSTMLKGTEIMATNVASSAINSFSLRGLVTGGDAFDEDAFGRGAFGRDAMAGVAAGMAGNFVQKGLDSRISSSSLSGFADKYAGGVRNLTGTLGNLASTGVTYAMTGNARVNLINTSMFGLKNTKGGAVSVGLFEFGFGMDGVQAGIGMGTIASAIQGYKESSKVVDWKFGSEKQKADLNAINLLGWTGEKGNGFNVGLSKEIWSVKLKTRYEDMGENDNGYYDRAQRSDEIVLSTALLGGGKEAAAKLATVMSHEGTHAYGNRVEAVAHMQGLATYGQIASIFDLDMDSGFTQSMTEAIKNPDSWKENVGSRDNWKVISYADGTHRMEAEYDKHGNLIKTVTMEYRDKDGNITGSVTPDNQDFQNNVGQAESLVNALGLDRAKALLGDDMNRISSFDDQTLKDVLNLDDSQIQSLRKASGVSIQDMGLSDSKLKRLAGEALLKRSGYAFDGNNWRKENPTNQYLDGVSLTDNLTMGYINAKALSGGTFDYSSAMVSVGRDPLSNMIFNDENGYNKGLAGRDSVTISSYNLDGSQRNEPRTFDGWTTVQTAYPRDKKNALTGDVYDHSSFVTAKMDAPSGTSFDINVGPETVQEGSIGWTIAPLDHNWPEISKSQGDILLQYSSGTIFQGNSINAEGNAGYDYGRHWVHPTINWGNCGCGVTGTIGEISGQDSYTNFLNYITNDLDLNIGYTLLGDLYQKNNPYFSVSRNPVR